MRKQEKLRAKLIETNLERLVESIKFDIMLDALKRWFEDEEEPSDDNRSNKREYDRTRS